MAQLLEGSPRDDGELGVGVRWGGLEGGEACEGGIKPVVPGGKSCRRQALAEPFSSTSHG